MTSEAAESLRPATYWNEAGGQAWTELHELTDRLYHPIAEAVVERAYPGPGGRVLDVGCGPGATTLDMARRLGPEGRCVGADVSAGLLALARGRAGSEGLAQAEFILGDAQTYDFGEAAFDAVMSRFGVMFFQAPVVAFANLRRAVAPGGGLAFACWRGPAENPLSQEPAKAAAPFLPELPHPVKDEPGRFAFADPARVRGILENSGWREVEIAPLDVATPLSFDELMTMSLRLGPVGAALQQQTEAVRAQVGDAVAARLQAYAEDGMVPMTAACWLVTARH
jgi:SAM-dependent methyltransferase